MDPKRRATGSDFNVTHFLRRNLEVASLADHVSDITTVIKSLEWLQFQTSSPDLSRYHRYQRITMIKKNLSLRAVVVTQR